jgi:acyl carrier protein
MTAEETQMIEYILRRIRKPSLIMDENTPLVSSGLVDSMALGDLVLTLEDLTRTRIPPGKVKPKDLDTVAMMFATAARVGKPQK